MVVPTHNSRRWIDTFMGAGTLEASADITCVVVDNGSTDGTPEAIESRWPGIYVVRLEENIGYGAAANRGAAERPDADVLVLNVDTAVQAEAVRTLVATLDANEDVGLVAPRLMDRAGAGQHSAYRFPTLRMLAAQSIGLATIRARQISRDRPQAVDWAPGVALLIRREAWDEIGGFDPAFFFFVEEVDLQQRLATAGWSRVIEPGATIVHYGGGSVIAADLFAKSHDGWERYFGVHGNRARQSAARALLCVTCVSRALRWTAIAAASSGRRCEALLWAKMFAGVLQRSAPRVLPALRTRHVPYEPVRPS